MRWQFWIATVGLGFALASPGCSCNSNATGSCANGQACPANSTCDTTNNLCYDNDAGLNEGSSSSSGGGACVVTGSCYGGVACPIGSTCNEATNNCCAYSNASGGASGQGGSGGGSSGASGGAPVTGSCANGQSCPSGSTCDSANGNCYGNITGSCANGASCPTGSTCDSANGNCYASSGGSSSGASGSGGTGGASGGAPTTGSCANGAACPTGSTCDTANSTCYANVTGSCAGGAACPTGSACDSANGNCYASSSGGSNGGASGGGAPIVTGSCFDGGVCPSGSMCTSLGLCVGTYGASGGASNGGGSGGTSSGPPYFWSGTSGGLGGGTGGQGSSGQVALGTCNDGGMCPQGTTCDTSDWICWGTVGSSGGNPFGGGGSSSGAANPPAAGVGTPCGTNPSLCIPDGLFCDPLNQECEVPTTGEPCLPTPGCQGTGVSCLEEAVGGGYICAIACTTTADCTQLNASCQQSTQLKGKTCQPNQCSNYFGSCNAAGTNDGTCEVISFGDLFSCNIPGGCGLCVQGGSDPDGQSCDQTRGTGSDMCQTGSTCSGKPGGNTMCAPLCSPYNGPTLCPYGYGCFWPIGQAQGDCILICPIDPLCPLSVPYGGCSNCNDFASLLCLGSCCVMDCPGSSYCQLLDGLPIPACLP